VTGRTLIAGIGNVFLGDDGFGVEVAQRLSREPLPDRVRILDAGIRARHLAYEILDGAYDTAILVDAVTRGGTPGTVYLIEPDPANPQAATPPGDGHAMGPGAMLAFVSAFGAGTTRMLVVGCEPASIEDGIGLSAPVAAAVNEAVELVRGLVCA
jgi:hydrogenase maturation protease